jgi:hypothetical protein
MSEYVCPISKKVCKGLCECKIPIKDIPKKCRDKFDAAFRFYRVQE